MSRGDPKFASEKAGLWRPHDYGKVYAHQNRSSDPSLSIAASHEGSQLLQDLSQVLSEPFFLLYVLVVPRGGSSEGRYQSDELSRREVDGIFERFGGFWDNDGRHSIWLRSHSDDATLVYDRHNLIYAYGPIGRFESLLISLGYSMTLQLSLAFVHQHAYHQEFDDLERELTTRFADRRSDLREGDENP
jgi:hypothetical protein